MDPIGSVRNRLTVKGRAFFPSPTVGRGTTPGATGPERKANMKKAFKSFRNVVSTFNRKTAAAIAALSAVLAGGTASAQYTPETVSVDNLFDFAALGITVLTVLGAAYAVVVGVRMAVGIAMSVAAKLKGGRV